MSKFEARIATGADDQMIYEHRSDRPLSVILTCDNGTIEVYMDGANMVHIWTSSSRRTFEENNMVDHKLYEGKVSKLCEPGVKSLIQEVALQQLEKRFDVKPV